MTDDLRLDLDDRLARAGDALAVPPGDLDAVVGRARHRSRRQRQAAALLTAVAVLGAVTGLALATRDDGGREVAVGGIVTGGAVDLAWRRVVPASAIGHPIGTGGDDVLYALSTAPGQRAFDGRSGRVLWRSADGIEWEAAATLGDDLYLSDLSTDGDTRVYAVGTAPGAAALGGRQADLVVGWSDDGGRTWQRATLPYDMRALAAATKHSGVSHLEVAVGPHGVVAVGVPYAQLDVPRYLPEGAAAPHGWAVTATGVDVLGPMPPGGPCPGTRMEIPEGADQEPPGEVWPMMCPDDVLVRPQEHRGVVASYTWAQLGVEGDLLDAVRRQPVAFAAPPGGTDFRRVALPGVDPVAGSAALTAGDDGFQLVLGTMKGGLGTDEAALEVLRSADGERWDRQAGIPGRLDYVRAVGELGERTLVVGAGRDGAAVVRSDGAGGWLTTPLASLLDPAVVAGRAVFPSAADVGPWGVAIVVTIVPDDGQEARTVDHRVLLSRDGETWAEQRLADLVGDERIRTAYRAHVDDDRVVLAVALAPEGGTEGPSRQVVLVGEPTD